MKQTYGYICFITFWIAAVVSIIGAWSPKQYWVLLIALPLWVVFGYGRYQFAKIEHREKWEARQREEDVSNTGISGKGDGE